MLSATPEIHTNYKIIDVSNSTLRVIDLYLDCQKYFSDIYGPQTIVFIQDGKFYESFATEDEGANLHKIEEVLQVKLTTRGRKTNSKDPRSNPYMLGFPLTKLHYSLNTLTRSGYTVVVYEEAKEVTSDKKIIIKRHFAGIYSPGTYITENKVNATYMMSAYIAEERQFKTGEKLIVVGVTLVDNVTGASIVHEFYGERDDENMGLDELSRIIQSYNPVESIIYFHPDPANDNNTKLFDTIMSHLELDRIKHSFYVFTLNNKDIQHPYVDRLNLLYNECFTIIHQNAVLASVFDLNSQINLRNKTSPIEILGVERNPYIIMSLIILIRYLLSHNVNLLKNLAIPEFYAKRKHLSLGNNAIEQLNVVDSHSLELYDNKIGSLFDVLNKTNTPMGKRLLRYSLINPFSTEQKDFIQKRYDMIEQLMSHNMYKSLMIELRGISDMERYHRKMANGNINPFEFARLNSFYSYALKAFNLVKNLPVFSELITADFLAKTKGYINNYENIFELSTMDKCINFGELCYSIFKNGYNKLIDKISSKTLIGQAMLNDTKQKLKSILESSGSSKKGFDNEKVRLESTDTEGYHFKCGKNNAKIIEDYLKKKDITLRVNDTKYTLKGSSFVFKTQKSGVKIFCEDMAEYTNSLDSNLIKLRKLSEAEFIKTINELYHTNKILLKSICKIVAEVDVVLSGATVARDYAYCKPTMVPSESGSFINTTDLRHPIIERLCKETAYVPNSVSLGNGPKPNENGILLFGINSCGKSSLMKSVALSVIMAQIGYYVPAKKYEFWPYMSLFARITGNDNMFKGLSSFVLEMTELKAILARTTSNGKNTLVIGDEVCRGTNDSEAQGIVAATLCHLSKSDCSFIFASHLHDLPKIPEVSELKNLRIFHLVVEYDDKRDILIYNRKMQPGSGPKSYALLVAKYIINNTTFKHLAQTITTRLTGNGISTIPLKKSNYNKSLVIKQCSICNHIPSKAHNKPLDTHHINFQCNCDENKHVTDSPHMSKDELYNIVPLCKRCHTLVHAGDIVIDSWMDSSIGPILMYDMQDLSLPLKLHDPDYMPTRSAKSKPQMIVNTTKPASSVIA